MANNTDHDGLSDDYITPADEAAADKRQRAAEDRTIRAFLGTDDSKAPRATGGRTTRR
jgi:hypothetical protein